MCSLTSIYACTCTFCVCACVFTCAFTTYFFVSNIVSIVIQVNRSLTFLSFDSNGASKNGLSLFAAALERNTTLFSVPLPLSDLAHVDTSASKHIADRICQSLYRNRTSPPPCMIATHVVVSGLARESALLSALQDATWKLEQLPSQEAKPLNNDLCAIAIDVGRLRTFSHDTRGALEALHRTQSDLFESTAMTKQRAVIGAAVDAEEERVVKHVTAAVSGSGLLGEGVKKDVLAGQVKGKGKVREDVRVTEASYARVVSVTYSNALDVCERMIADRLLQRITGTKRVICGDFYLNFLAVEAAADAIKTVAARPTGKAALDTASQCVKITFLPLFCYHFHLFGLISVSFSSFLHTFRIIFLLFTYQSDSCTRAAPRPQAKIRLCRAPLSPHGAPLSPHAARQHPTCPRDQGTPFHGRPPPSQPPFAPKSAF